MPTVLLNSVGIVFIGDRLNFAKQFLKRYVKLETEELYRTTYATLSYKNKDGDNFILSQLSTKTEISFKKVHLKA